MATGGSSSGGFEHQRNAVHAVTQPGRLGAVVEDVTQMPAAAAAINRGPRHAKAGVVGLADGPVERRPEARPAGMAIEFRGR